MNRDDIIRMAQEAGYVYHVSGGTGTYVQFYWDQLEQFANLVAAAEREACAQIAENWNCNGMPRYGVAEAIREKGAPALERLNKAAEDNGEPL
jgi:hypothetical protein